MQKIDIIYNTTSICPWDCEICCVDAIHVKKKGNDVVIRHHGLAESETFKIENTKQSHFDLIYEERKKRGLELSLEQKIHLLNNLEGYNVKMDISGGDPLVVKENFEFLKIASTRLGKNNLTLTATGLGLMSYDSKLIASLISEFNFTYDANQFDDIVGRPEGYAKSNLKIAKEMAALGCKTRAEFPLNKKSISREHLNRIYKSLHESKIDTLLLMRLFPVGRGAQNNSNIPSKSEYHFAITTFLELEKEYLTPKIKLQCALKHLIKDFYRLNNPCDLVKESLGLMADGTLLASPWAINEIGKPLSDSWVLGNLYEMSLKSILSSVKVQEFKSRLDENFGHCKIFAYLGSPQINDIDRMFDSTDNLYIE